MMSFLPPLKIMNMEQPGTPASQGGVLRISSDGDDRMRANSKPQKMPKASKEPPQKTLDQKLTPKIPCRLFEPQKFPERINPQVTSERYQEFTTAKGNSSEDTAG